MHIFGVTLQCAFKNLKCSIIGWPTKSTLPVELDSGRGGNRRNAFEAAEEIEMPPGAAEFAVGRELETDLGLLLDDLLDLAVFDFFQRGGDLAFGEFGARLLQGRGSQQAADHVGAKRRRGALGHDSLRY
jgi:hypothetical protein